MKLHYTYFFLLLFFGFYPAQSSFAQQFGDADQWESLNPGGGGQIQDLYFDQLKEGRMWFSSDMEGIYRSDDFGNSWQHVSRDLIHSMSFTMKQSHNGSRMYQGGLFNANISDNADADDPKNITWTPIPITEGDAIAAIAISSDDQTVVLAPGWQNKDPQKCQKALLEPVQDLTTDKFNGKRNIYISRDAGSSWESVNYEAEEGYRHVFGVAIHPQNDHIFIGSASGVYQSTNQGHSFTLIPEPADALRGAGYANSCNNRPDGGSRGLTIDPTGKHLYAVYQTQGGSNYLDKRWAVYHASIGEDGAVGDWEKIMTGLQDNCEWYNPKVDPRSTANSQKLMVGVVWGNNVNRVGLWENTLNFDEQDALVSDQWEWIIDKPSTANCFDFEIGWEDRGFIVRAFDYAPLSWSNPAILAMGGMNVFLGNPANEGFPCTPGSWKEVYGMVVPSEASTHTMSRTRGFASPYAYDMSAYKNYMVQGNADHGMLQSFDYGYSWSSEAGPSNVTNAMATLIIEGDNPLVLVDGRVGWGAPSPVSGGLYAHRLNLEKMGNASDWKLIGGSSSSSAATTNGLPSRNYRVITNDPSIPQRVYIGTRGASWTGTKGGIYLADDISAVYEGQENWRKITDSSFDNFDVRDVWVDPYDSDYIYCAGHHSGNSGRIFRGKRNADGSYTWTDLPSSFNKGTTDLYAWDRGNGSSWLVAATTINNVYGIYINKSPQAANFNNAAAWEYTGFDTEASLEIRPEKWQVRERTINIGGLAAYGDYLVACTMIGTHKKGLGVFLAKVTDDENLSWSDWTYSGKNQVSMPHPMTNQAKIFIENDTPYYYVATAGIGPWRRSLPVTDCDLSLPKSTLVFPAEGGSQSITVGGAADFELAVNHDFISVAKNGRTLTITVAPYGDVVDRQGVLAVMGCGSEHLSIIQEAAESKKYELILKNATGAGFYEAGQQVTVSANADEGAGVFLNWAGATFVLGQALEEREQTFVMPERNVNLWAEFVPTSVTLTVVGGAGSGDYEVGEAVSITADAADEGLMFDRWTGAVATISDVNQASTTMIVPSKDAVVQATYKTATYALNVEGGEGSGFYQLGDRISIKADDPAEGFLFDQWTGDVAALDDAGDRETTITMPAEEVNIKSSYREIVYLLKVINGTNEGRYPKGEIVTIEADAPAEGARFVAWTGDTEFLEDATAPKTAVTMPAHGVKVEATYETQPLNASDGTQLVIMPNPAKGHFVIPSLDQKTTINIFSPQGALIQQSITDNQGRVDISGLQSGIYIVQFGMKSTKLIVTH
ncbi:InlB B-repeat-containing protein [Persicobacter psychrovividus]|uniref:T9SS type A sorting domain-containing protein n=1 Tax=Persicobacter psychrovividus TaxID=387638 RepID=A0ABN6L7K9_9BACT|nr:hypothetical protein PEPS_14510 [Persicobacter psychrovividus]